MSVLTIETPLFFSVKPYNRRGLIKKYSKTYQTLQKLNWEGHYSRTSGILTV